jgi:hypothetical protein
MPKFKESAEFEDTWWEVQYFDTISLHRYAQANCEAKAESILMDLINARDIDNLYPKEFRFRIIKIEIAKEEI